MSAHLKLLIDCYSPEEITTMAKDLLEWNKKGILKEKAKLRTFSKHLRVNFEMDEHQILWAAREAVMAYAVLKLAGK